MKTSIQCKSLSIRGVILSAGMALLCWSGSPALAAPPESPRKMAADALAEVQAIKAELDIIEERLRTQETESRKREKKVLQEGATAVAATRLEAEQRMTAERAAWQAESQRLQQEMQAAAAREEARRQAEPPKVGASAAGVSLTGYLQSDLVFRQSSESQLNPTSGVPLNEDRFLIRRARLMLDMDRRYGEGNLEIDAQLAGDAHREGRLAQARRAVEEHVPQRLAPLAGRVDGNLQPAFRHGNSHHVRPKLHQA